MASMALTSGISGVDMLKKAMYWGDTDKPHRSRDAGMLAGLDSRIYSSSRDALAGLRVWRGSSRDGANAFRDMLRFAIYSIKYSMGC
jgi:hypothetical protein